MKIGDLFRKPNIANSSSAPTGKTDVLDSGRELQEQSARVAPLPGDDRVTISPEARQFARISKIVGDDEGSRRDKVEDIKRRIENGDYNVSSEAVAKSILAYSQQSSSKG